MISRYLRMKTLQVQIAQWMTFHVHESAVIKVCNSKVRKNRQTDRQTGRQADRQTCLWPSRLVGSIRASLESLCMVEEQLKEALRERRSIRRQQELEENIFIMWVFLSRLCGACGSFLSELVSYIAPISLTSGSVCVCVCMFCERDWWWWCLLLQTNDPLSLLPAAS